MTPSQENCLFNIHHLTYERWGGEVNSSFLRTRKKDFLVLLDLNCIIVDLDFSSIRPKCRAMVMVDYLFGITSMTYVVTVNIFYGKCRACIYSSSS